MTEQYENNNEDEISLIDLFAVLVRYRKLVVIGTLAVALAAFAWLFVLPKFVPSLNKKTLTISYALKTERLPSSVFNATGYDVLKSAVDYMQDPAVISECQRDFHIFENAEQAIVGGTFSVQSSNASDRITLLCKIPAEKENELNAFILELLKSTNSYIEDSAMQRINSLEENADKIIEQYGNLSLPVVWREENEKSEIKTISVSVNCLEISSDIKTFKASHDKFVSAPILLSSVVDSGKRTIKFIIVATFAAFFIFVFTAFLLNAIENIRNDENAVSLIKKAWDEGK